MSFAVSAPAVRRRPAFTLTKRLVAVIVILSISSAAATGGIIGQAVRSAIAAPMAAPGNMPNTFTVTINGVTTIPVTWNPAFTGLPSAINRPQTAGGWTGQGAFANFGHPIAIAVFFDTTFSSWRLQFSFPDGCAGNTNAVAAAWFDAGAVKGSFPVSVQLSNCGCATGFTATVP